MALQQNPLNLPEILDNLKQFLDCNDSVKYIKVCKVWYNTFLPFIWKEIDFTREPHFPKDSVILKKHSNLVTAIRIDHRSPSFAHETLYPCLQKLVISSAVPRKIFPSNILCNHTTIQHLTIGYAELPKDFNLLETISRYLSLRTLKITLDHLNSSNVPAFWATLGRLKEASLSGIKIPDNLITDPSTPQTLQNMTHLQINHLNSQLPFEILKRATKLEILDLHLNPPRGNQLYSFLHQKWPNLHRIRISSTLYDTQIQHMLSSITRLTALDFSQPNWEYKSFQALSHHFGTLEKLSQPALSFTSEMLNTVLCSCPNLIEIIGWTINGFDIVDNVRIIDDEQPSDGWICTQMRYMTLAFDLEDIHSQIPVLENLVRLTKLVELNMQFDEDPYEEQAQAISLSLYDGLEMLKPLKELRKITVSGRNQALTKSDIEWMVENWKSLESLDGKLDHDEDHHQALRAYLKEFGIKGRYFHGNRYIQN